MPDFIRRIARRARRKVSRGDPTKGVAPDQLNDVLRRISRRGPAVEQLNGTFLQFGRHLPGRDAEFWQLLRAYLANLMPSVDDPKVLPQARVLATLVDRDRREAADAFVASFGLKPSRFRTSVDPSGVLVELPGFGDLPDNLFRLTDAQLKLKAAITSTRWDSGLPVIEGHAYIEHIDLAAHPTTVRLQLVDAAGSMFDLDTQPFSDDRIDELSKHYYADYRASGFRATTGGALPQGPLRVLATVETAGFTRTGDVGELSPAVPATGPVVTSISADGNTLELTFDGVAPSEVLLVSPRRTLRADVAETARFDIAADGLAPPTGTFDLVVKDATGRGVSVAVDADVDLLLPLARVRTQPAIRIIAPLDPDERGNRNQQRLRDASRVPRADRDAVFFRALYGEVANCNGRAVHRELVRRGTSLELFWSVRDLSVAVPEGGVAILEGSRAWHGVIATARYHMINVHQLDWFTKPEGQVMIQTMHGYPYKTMGHDWWAKGDFPAAQIAQFDRRAREWDYFVSPATYATPLLDAAFLAPADAHPKVLEIGYPRNDDLVAPSASATRDRVRAELGISADQTVIMYAPTFRDYLAINDMKAESVDFFDAFAASRELGPNYVFLMRGHAFNARAGERRRSSPTVIDVTDHPEINDLCLASDAAILDYSSLRFDYALTDKPMVFLVPDLVEWHRARGGVIEYGPTAPGPHVMTTEEVVRHLTDIGTVASTWREARATFRADFVDLDDGSASKRLVDVVFEARRDT